MHAYYTPWEEGGEQERVYWHPFCDLHPRPWQLWKPPSITLSLPPSVEEDELALLDLFHQQPILLNPRPCTCCNHMHSGCGSGIVHHYYNCSYRKFTRNVPIVGKIPTINRKESSSTCMNTIKAKPPPH